MNSVIVSPLGNQGKAEHADSTQGTLCSDPPKSDWREIAHDAIAAVLVSSAIVALAYFYWTA